MHEEVIQEISRLVQRISEAGDSRERYQAEQELRTYLKGLQMETRLDIIALVQLGKSIYENESYDAYRAAVYPGDDGIDYLMQYTPYLAEFLQSGIARLEAQRMIAAR